MEELNKRSRDIILSSIKLTMLVMHAVIVTSATAVDVDQVYRCQPMCEALLFPSP